jgi:hypothetical protein
MSAVMTLPELMAGGATDLAAIGSTLDAAHLAVAPATVTVPPAAANEVLTAVAQVFSQCAQEYYAVAGQAASFHDQFVQTLSAGATSYASAEATNIGLLQPLNLFDSVQSEVLSLVNAVQPVLTGLFAVLNRLLFIAVIVALLIAMLINSMLQAQLAFLFG